MLHTDDQGNWTNWAESQAYLETQGLLDRKAFEQELAIWHQDQRYTFKNAESAFIGLVREHIHQRVKQQKPDYHDHPNIHANEGRTRCSIYLGGGWSGNWQETRCAAPDWLTKLYWEEADQRLRIKWPYAVGTLLYCASSNKMYVVYEQDTISPQEAADLEDGWDIFDAEGTYSHLCYPRTDEEHTHAQLVWEAQQGTIGSLEIFEVGTNSPLHFRPKVLLPGKGQTFMFSSYEDHSIIESPHSFDAGHWFIGGKPHEGTEARVEALAFLNEYYPEIRLVEWSEFQQLEAQRI